MGIAQSLPLTNGAAVRVNDTLRFSSLISKHRLIFLLSYGVCVCVWVEGSFVTLNVTKERVSATHWYGKRGSN